LLLGAGAVLTVAPFLWPRRRRVRRQSRWQDWMHERLTQAGLEPVTPAVVAAVSILFGAIVGAVVLAVVQVVAVAVAAGVASALLPVTIIGRRALAHRRLSRTVWPDVVDQLISAVRAGLALPEAVASVAGAGPTRTVFEQFAADYRTTGNFSLCLDELKRRLADPVADRIIETLRMSREVGGTELVTVLKNLGAHLRHEAAIRSEAEARQSWVRNAAKLGVAAPWVVLLLLATRPEAAAAYNSTGGATLIIVGLVVSAVAYRLMLRLGRLPEQRRWFA
jgi:tight adherence protein B